jgi:hypothetical protein
MKIGKFAGRVAKKIVKVWYDEEERQTRNRILFAVGIGVLLLSAGARVRYNRKKRLDEAI